MKRILTFSILLNLLSLYLFEQSLAQIQILQVKRNIPLSDEEAVYKDYYLAGGLKEGLKLNLVVPVTRWVNLRESNQSQDQSVKILEPVGWLKIIFIQDHLSVARLHERVNFLSSPILDQSGILVGDLVSLEKAYFPKPSSPVKPQKDSAHIIEVTTQVLSEKENKSTKEQLPTIINSQEITLAKGVDPEHSKPEHSKPDQFKPDQLKPDQFKGVELIGETPKE